MPRSQVTCLVRGLVANELAKPGASDPSEFAIPVSLRLRLIVIIRISWHNAGKNGS